jgi:hypothetical protein
VGIILAEAKQELPQFGEANAAGSERGFRYKDTLCLTAEFNTAFNYATSPEGFVVAPTGEVTIYGTIDRNVLPVRNAVQPELRGGWDMYVMQFDRSGSDIRYCTYLGGYGIDEVPNNNNYGMAESRLRQTQSGYIVGCFRATEGAPLTSRSFKAYPHLTEPRINPWGPPTSYIFTLDGNGALFGSTYLGGPQVLEPEDIHVVEEDIYILGSVAGMKADTLSDISPNAIMRTRGEGKSSGVVLSKISLDCSKLYYMTYVESDGTYQGSYNSVVWGAMAVKNTGEAIIAMGIAGDSTAILAGIPPSPGMGIWVACIGANGDSTVFSRLFDTEFPGLNLNDPHEMGVQYIFPRASGEIDLFGRRPILKGAILPPRWSRQTLIDGPGQKDPTEGTYWMARLSPTGDLIRGIVFGDADEEISNGYHLATVLDETCGGYVQFHWSGKGNDWMGNPIDGFVAHDPVDSSHDEGDNRYIISLDEDLGIRYATPWNSAYYINGAKYHAGISRQYYVDHHGYAYQYASTTDPYAARQMYRSWRLPRSPEPCWPLNCDYHENYLTRFRIYTPCWQVGCSIATIDSIRIERRRGYIEPAVFTVDYAVTNHSPAREARIVHAIIELPPGLVLASGTAIQPVTPAMLAAGQTAQCSWTVTSDGSGALPDTALIRCRVFYVDPESGQTYPMGEELCEQDVHVFVFDEREPDLECTVEGPEEIFWVGDGYAESPSDASGTIRYLVTYTNHDQSNVTIDRFRLRVPRHSRIFGDTLRPGIVLAPGASHQLEVRVYVNGLRYERALRVSAEALDDYGLTISYCEKETRVPGYMDIPCAVTGPERVTWNTATGGMTPSVLPYVLELENPIDTVRSSVRAWLDLSAAPHLRPAAGDSLARPPFVMERRTRITLNWRLEPGAAPSFPAHDTLAFVYEYDGIERRCLHVVEIMVIDQTVLCDVQLPATHTASLVESRASIPLTYTLTNAGTVPVEVNRLELAIAPVNSGLTALDPVTLSGIQLAPGGVLPWNLRLRAAILRAARTATCTVTAYGKSASDEDSVLSVCDASIDIEGVDGLRCLITAPDSVRFEHDSLCYVPDPVPVVMDLSNILDTGESAIEAEVDLSSAPRFALANGEIALKTRAFLDSHSMARFTWLLSPIAAATHDNQVIVIRYRSAEQGGWKECYARIFLAAWPEIAEVRCSTGGHDSLFADAAYELIVPEPFQVSYTAMNSGTVTLTGCSAAIVLPEGFALVGSDSIQSFGANATKALAPGESATRWWTLGTTDQLQGFGAKDITWRWSSDQQGSGTGCTHRVLVIPDPSSGITFTPLRLYFEAELGGTLPMAQQVKLWTGGGLSMPWTSTSDTWYIDLAPMAGDHAASISVQPNTTVLNKGLHSSTITLAGSAPNLPQQIAVDYMITSLTGIEDPPHAQTLTLGAVYPHPIPMQGEARLLLRTNGQAIASGTRVRITLHDLLGRERAVLRDDIITETDILILRPAAMGLEPGNYLLRVLSPDGMSARMVTVVR